jgi:hypothetical protein
LLNTLIPVSLVSGDEVEMERANAQMSWHISNFSASFSSLLLFSSKHSEMIKHPFSRN